MREAARPADCRASVSRKLTAHHGSHRAKEKAARTICPDRLLFALLRLLPAVQDVFHVRQTSLRVSELIGIGGQRSGTIRLDEFALDLGDKGVRERSLQVNARVGRLRLLEVRPVVWTKRVVAVILGGVCEVRIQVARSPFDFLAPAVPRAAPTASTPVAAAVRTTAVPIDAARVAG